MQGGGMSLSLSLLSALPPCIGRLCGSVACVWERRVRVRLMCDAGAGGFVWVGCGKSLERRVERRRTVFFFSSRSLSPPKPCRPLPPATSSPWPARPRRWPSSSRTRSTGGRWGAGGEGGGEQLSAAALGVSSRAILFHAPRSRTCGPIVVTEGRVCGVRGGNEAPAAPPRAESSTSRCGGRGDAARLPCLCRPAPGRRTRNQRHSSPPSFPPPPSQHPVPARRVPARVVRAAQAVRPVRHGHVRRQAGQVFGHRAGACARCVCVCVGGGGGEGIIGHARARAVAHHPPFPPPPFPIHPSLARHRRPAAHGARHRGLPRGRRPGAVDV